MKDEIPATPLKAPLQIRFVIVGGGIAGLASAIALARVGHQPIVLEKSDGRKNRGKHGLRISPNMSKILYHWGLKQQLLDIGLVSSVLLFTRSDREELLGAQIWDYELLEEARGDFILTAHEDLHRVLSETAIAHGVDIRYNAEVVDIDPDCGEVRLSSGESMLADVIVGADGETGISRGTLVGQHDRGTPVGMSVVSATFDTAAVTRDVPDEIKDAVDLEKNMIFVAFGEGGGAIGFPIHRRRDMNFHFLVQDSETEGTWGDPPCSDLKTLVRNPCDPRLRLVADNARDAVRVVIKEYSELDSWVHDSARLVVIGQAAHAIPPIAIQGHAMAVEDAAVLGKLFCHLSSREQIASFLYAFQDIRQRRVATIREVELETIWFMMLEDGPEQRVRDASMKAKYRAGKNAMAGEDGEEDTLQWKEVRETFGYDCEDEAENWWMQWGRLRERAKGVELSQPREMIFSFGVVSITESTEG
ncbi:FAD/NAD(P)-binding domain-containing protein [Daedalea quercina L-15889]|uniref:FAD/NAD(P)-binding domain-containing protein n=1 Tax=Daedalea quercina L-15889 TaxID=1314783 RepID=A0A165TKH0_9APHY|nr:FAD/NAD(P)-binding domain-containing protein [Daedalea quercina L-15889]